jgi:acyl-CoA thioesterase-1
MQDAVHLIEEGPMMSVFKPTLAMLVAAAIALGALPGRDVSAQTAVRIVALGASNTEGWGLSPEHAYPVRLQALLRAKGIDATVANAGIAGDTTGGMLARLDSVAPAGTHIVVLQPGTNDERMGLGAERTGNIEKMRALLDARGTRLLVIENAVLDALPRSELRDDGVHFTPAGYVMLAERILPQVLAALGK